jgi:hypothetical protein
MEKDSYLKSVDEPKDSEKYVAFDKELMDLKIILNLYFNDNETLESERLGKFVKNLEK